MLTNIKKALLILKSAGLYFLLIGVKFGVNWRKKFDMVKTFKQKSTSGVEN